MKMEKKTKIMLIVIAILLIGSIILRISYAYWQITHNQTGKNTIDTGCFNIVFEETGNDITITNGYPVIDSVGLASKPYKFKITNDCSIDAKYDITLNSFGSTTNLLSDSAIAYAFDLSSSSNFNKKILGSATENTETSNINLTDLIKSYILGSGFLRVGETKEYSLLLWVDEDAPIGEMSKQFQSKVYLTNIATDEAPSGYIMETPEVTIDDKAGIYDYFFESSITKDRFEEIYFLNTNAVSDQAIESFDVSAKQDGSVMAWYEDRDGNGLFEAYIGQVGGVLANPNSANLLANYSNVLNISLENLDTTYVINMHRFFYKSGFETINFAAFNTSKVENMSQMFYELHGLTENPLPHLNTSNVTDFSYMFYGCSSLTSLDLSNIDTKKATTLSYIFAYTNVSSLDLSPLNTANVTNMSGMFEGCNSIKTLDVSPLNTSKVTNMESMFSHVGIISLDLSTMDVSNVKDMSRMFWYNNSLTSLNTTGWNTSKVEDMSNMFYLLSNITTLDLSHFDTSNVKNMSWMLGGNKKLTNLNLSNWNTSNVTNMEQMFSSNTALETLDLSHFNTSNVTSMAMMFAYNTNLKNLNVSNWDTRKVTSMAEMFLKCSSLITLDLSSFETPVLSMFFDPKRYDPFYDNGAFYGCNSLVTLNLKNMTFDSVTLVGKAFDLPATTNIYVKDAAQSTIISKWAKIANVIDCSSTSCP